MKTLAVILSVGAALAWVAALSTHPGVEPSDDTFVALVTRGGRTRVTSVRVHRGARGELEVTKLTRAAGSHELVHAEDSALRGALLDGEDLLVTAEREAGRDRSFASSLWRVSASGIAPLLDGVALASRPLVVGRRAYIQRGIPGAHRDAGPRTDEVFVTELDLDRGTTRTVAQLSGQMIYPIGVDADLGLVAYAIGGPDSVGAGGRLVAFSLERPGSVDLGEIGTARDFSLVPQAFVEGRSLGPAIVYEAIRPHVRSIEVRALTGERATEKRERNVPLAPLVLPGGHLQITHAAADGTLEVPRGYSRALHVLLVARYRPGDPVPRWVLRAPDGTGELPLDALVADGGRLEPVGFTEMR